MFSRALAATTLGALALSVVPTVASSHTVDLGFAIEQSRKSYGYRESSRRRDLAEHGYVREDRRYRHRDHTYRDQRGRVRN